MIVFAAAGRQLDDWCRTVEDLAAAVEDEVVVGGDLAEGDGQRLGKPAKRYLVPAPPWPAFLEVGALAEGCPVTKHGSRGPEPTCQAGHGLERRGLAV